jgi:hypothetical protein
MQALVYQFLGLFKQRACEDHNTRGSITDFIVLRFGELHEQLRGLVLNLNIK